MYTCAMRSNQSWNKKEFHHMPANCPGLDSSTGEIKNLYKDEQNSIIAKEAALVVSNGYRTGLFFKYADTPVTVLAVKDRVLAHNPLGAIYQANAHYKERLFPEKDNPAEKDKKLSLCGQVNATV